MISINQTSLSSSEEDKFLATLNHNLPQGVDWKQGALDYVAARLREENGDIIRRSHLTKPFYSVRGDKPVNQQLQEFTREMTHFLNTLSLLSVSSNTIFLDVACGSGWWTHFLAKLNFQVVGTDISSDMIDLTRERLRLDGIPTAESQTYDQVTLLTHDMEASELPNELKCDIAVLESALHHFVNPIQTLRNIANSLSDDGIIIILEGSSDGKGDQYCVEIMNLYNTLERPYTRQQLITTLQFAGLAEYQFFCPINGFFLGVSDIANSIRDQVLYGKYWNVVFVAKRPGALKKYLNFEGSAFMVPSPLQQVTDDNNQENYRGQTVQETIDEESVMSDDLSPIDVQCSRDLSAINGQSWPELGIKGELRILIESLSGSSKRIVRKTIAKLMRK